MTQNLIKSFSNRIMRLEIRIRQDCDDNREAGVAVVAGVRRMQLILFQIIYTQIVAILGFGPHLPLSQRYSNECHSYAIPMLFHSFIDSYLLV